MSDFKTDVSKPFREEIVKAQSAANMWHQEAKDLQIRLAAKDARIASLEAGLSRMINHFAILPPSMDEPGSIMHEMRSLLEAAGRAEASGPISGPKSD